jgi:zinc transport system substrate-binding protein
LLACLAALACSPPAGERTEVAGDEPGALSVYVVNYPLQYMAEQIGGEHVDVVLPAPPDVDPALWSPGPETVAAYQDADLILLNGAGYARWIALASLPEARAVDTSARFGDRLIPLDEAVTHQHGPTGEHTHVGLAFTTWLDPKLAIAQAAAIAAAFVEARPAHAAAFRANLAELESDLRALDARFAEAAGRVGETPLVFSHPVYQYWIRRYGLRARSVHWEPGEAPDDDMWRALRELHARERFRWMIWEGPPLEETARRLRALGVESVVVDPCGNAPGEGDFLSAMQRNAEVLEQLARDVSAPAARASDRSTQPPAVSLRSRPGATPRG